MERSFVTVVRFDVHLGNSKIVRTFMFPPSDSAHNMVSPIYFAKIGNDIVITKELSHRLLVANWRTGEARVSTP